jgi:SAM-dependent methyltransferase/FKBP-type peptidyl-prolyl cis-trans isomerase 2
MPFVRPKPFTPPIIDDGTHSDIIGGKSIAAVKLQLGWESELARHTEDYFAPVNIWREADILPPVLAQALKGQKAGAQIKLSFKPGELTPLYDEHQKKIFSVKNFVGQRVPRLGRFYPRRRLIGYRGDPIPFRCIGVENSSFTADFNHPLGGKSLVLEALVHAVQGNRSERGGECTDWIDLLTSGPGMQCRWQGLPTDFFSDAPFRREDEPEDGRFYQMPRFVNHLDSRALETITALYGRLLKPDMAVLDLMGSCESHLPDSLALKSVIGLGLNAEELRSNPRLTGYLIHDLNQAPQLPFSDQAFDAVICTVSVEYLIRPLEVFQEVARILRPGGLFIQSFSNRWFPPKVTRIWTELHEFERLGLVLEYFLSSGAYGNLETYSSRGWPRPETDRYYPQVRFSDPIYAVWGQT